MKIVVYAVSRNSDQILWRWWDTIKNADEIVLIDVGSTDDTVKIARELHITVHEIRVDPWRPDDAFNTALALLPFDADVCVKLNIDDTVDCGWREAIEDQWGDANCGRYLYSSEHDENDQPRVSFWCSSIHARHGFRWKNPISETLESNRTTEISRDIQNMCVHHRPLLVVEEPLQPTEGELLDFLAVSTQNDEQDARSAYDYACGFADSGRSEEAAAEFKRQLTLPSDWGLLRAAACSGLARVEPQNAELWLLQACEEAKREREPLIDLAQFYHDVEQWEKCFITSMRALRINTKNLSELNQFSAWSSQPHDLAALSAYHLGNMKVAIAQGRMALSFDPDDQRLRKNLEWYLITPETRTTKLLV